MKQHNKATKYLAYLLSVVVLLTVWWILSETVQKEMGVIPSPFKTLELIGNEISSGTFFNAVGNTLWKSFLSFVVSFAAALIFAILSHFFKAVKYFLEPFMTVFRAVPTIALTLILLLVVKSSLLPAAVAFLVVFPLCYQNMYTAISEVDKNLLKMATIFRVPKVRQIFQIYFPAMLPYIFASVIGGFGLNIKVIISAEVIGFPTMSIGYMILKYKQSMDFAHSFAWLVIAVLLSFVCELILKAAARLSMPFKYPDQKILKSVFKKKVKNNVETN